MRLLNAKTLTLSSFVEVANSYNLGVPEYVILSHTWGQEEVTFADIQRVNDTDVQAMRGIKKIRFTCDQAVKDGYEWIWIDTCCIDKSSSAELSEAINSMYNWYAGAEYCYAYLEDVSHHGAESALPGQSIGQSLQTEEGQRFVKFGGIHQPSTMPGSPWQLQAAASIFASRWFTRGWTLQELLAPLEVRFFSQSGVFLGSKRDLMVILVEKTRIPAQVLADPSLISSCSISMRMGWMSNRRTTRQEDLAYCLLGLFDVNMPLLYGEGHKAFQRLQRVILEASDDETLLAWQGDWMAWHGPFAVHPEAFERSFTPLKMTLHEELPIFTSRGLTMKRGLYLRRRRKSWNKSNFLTKLNCKDGRGHNLYLLLSAAQVGKTVASDDYIFFRKGCQAIFQKELREDWQRLETRDLTISWSNFTSSVGKGVYLDFKLCQEHHHRRAHRSTSGILKLLPDDIAHDITLHRGSKHVVQAFTRYPFIGLYTSLFKFRLGIDQHFGRESTSLEVIIEIDHMGRGSAYLNKQTDQKPSNDQNELQKYLQDVQEFILLQSQRTPATQRAFRKFLATDKQKFPSPDFAFQENEATIDTFFAGKLPCEEHAVQQTFERKDRIRSALEDSGGGQILSLAPPDIARASLIKLRDSWLVVEVNENDRMPRIGVTIWRLLSPPEEDSSIDYGEILI